MSVTSAEASIPSSLVPSVATSLPSKVELVVIAPVIAPPALGSAAFAVVVVEVNTASLAAISTPSTVPDTFKLPFKSTVGAVSCISVSATISSCPSTLEFMYIALSLNCIFWSVAVVLPLAKTSVNVSEVATWLSTYALIDCCVDNFVGLLDAILSSSRMSVIVTEPVPDKLLNSTAARSVFPATVKVLSTNKSGMDIF